MNPNIINGFIIITNSQNFSDSIKNYFLSDISINKRNVMFFSFALDKLDPVEEITKLMNLNSKKCKKISQYFIFSDFGESWIAAKKLKEKFPEMILSSGSIIENGYLTFKLLNARAPIETIQLIVSKHITKT